VDIALTGTPGTGKTSVANILKRALPDFNVVHLNEFLIDKKLYEGRDEKRDSYMVDVDRLRKEVKRYFKSKEDLIFEGHLSHYLDADLVIVLRTNPKILKKRLESKGYSKEKVRENVEAEALDVILIESLEIHEGKVREINTTNISVLDAAGKVKDIIIGRGDYEPGKIDWSEDFF